VVIPHLVVPPTLPVRPLSPWLDPEHAEDPDRYGRLDGDTRVDVAVVGAGITGLTTAVLLAREGLHVAVLEARHIGAVTSGNTTAKISILQGTRGGILDARHGPEVVEAYFTAHRAGMDWLLDRARTVDCDLERREAVTFATSGRSGSAAEEVRREAAVLRRAGIPAALRTDVGLPFAVSEAVTLADQAQFDPVPYLNDLARELADAGHGVYENTRVLGVSLLGAPQLRTEHGRVRAERVVLATGIPVLDRGLYFARVEPARSYGQVAAVDGDLPEAMYLSADSPTVSLRTAVVEGERRLLVGGFGHRVGASTPMSSHERDLADWTARHFPVRRVTHRWSAQDYLPEDGLPFVGPMPLQSRVMVATGFAKWGMTGGTAAALALADQVAGRENRWAEVFRADRVPAVTALPTLARANGEVARYLAGGWARPDLPTSAPLAEGEGRVETTRRGKVARCRVDGVEHTSAALCPHLGGVVAWNDAERSWDCPLHGSRFGPDGRVLEGPTTEALGSPPGVTAAVAPRGR